MRTKLTRGVVAGLRKALARYISDGLTVDSDIIDALEYAHSIKLKVIQPPVDDKDQTTIEQELERQDGSGRPRVERDGAEAVQPADDDPKVGEGRPDHPDELAGEISEAERSKQADEDSFFKD